MIKPRRIQRKREKGWRMPANTVYVGRPTKWGNPFEYASVFKRWLNGEIKLWAFRREVILRSLAELRGKDLACWCPLDQPCHADVLLELANA